ncbi:MAG TPA: arylamine N-acetyltransferase [Oscillospiraceae bacterium]|nr:arylamine N-acetyltransferase [Oscillospiraceae bacterium]
MSNESFNLEAYFKRINYQGKTDVTAETLKGLHIAHTLNVPFENLDVHFKKPIRLDRESLYQKIVENKRGGYCFEMNGMFSFVLKEMGFKVLDVLARGTRDGKEFFSQSHQVMVVEIGDELWLADVGFGNDGITAPVLLEEGVDQQQFTHTYRILKDPKHGYILQSKVDGEYKYMYAFHLINCHPMDFEMANYFMATYPNSFFSIMKMCTMPTKEGRVTLTDIRNEKKFKQLVNGQVTETNLNSEDEFKEKLQQYFALDYEAIKQSAAK